MAIRMTEAVELRILICAPAGRDARLAAGVLEQAGLSSFICSTLQEVLHELHRGAGALLTVEEILSTVAARQLVDYVAAQPAWSDLPLLVLTTSGADSPWVRGTYGELGNVTLLERPVRPAALLSAMRSAVRARMRQYEIRLADQRKDEFLAMLGHELRNPLAPIGAAAQLLGVVSSDPGKVKATGAIIARQVAHLTSLIDDLLDVARVTRGLIVLTREPLDLRHILTEAVEQVNPLIQNRRHHLILHLSPAAAFVRGDRKRLVQVVANLLTNAARYTPEGGDIVVHLQVSQDQITLDVADNGIGMAPELVPAVFGLFAQAERNSDRSQGGLGLGLALVKNLVESHGGSVAAASEGSGKGSTFTIRLPRLTGNPDIAQADPPSDAEVPSVPVHPQQVMIVDDNIDSANMLAMLLDAMGYKTATEHTARKAIERAHRTTPPVCLLDIGLPDMDGTELAQQLRAIPHMANSTLIAVTGYGQEQDRQKSKAAGFDHHLVKPIDIKQLLRLLEQRH